MRRSEKPEMDQLCVDLLIRVLSDTATSLGLRYSSLERDIESLKTRSASEGTSFLTKTLPLLGKALDKALADDSELVVPPQFAAKEYGSGVIPVFMGELWKLIFRADGQIRRCDADTCNCRIELLPLAPDSRVPVCGSSARQVAAVRAIRQVCYLAYKMEGAHAPDSETEVQLKFVETDRSLPAVGEELPLSPSTSKALESARMLIWFVLRGFDPLDILPGHGPGAVAGGEKAWNKMKFKTFYPQLDEVYGYPDYFYFNYGHLCEDLDHLEGLTCCQTPVAKATIVPKDSRGPRLISMEPLEIQWIQQGLARRLMKRLESPSSPTCGFVNFTNQEVNQRLALEHSKGDGTLVTLDLSDASDRVSLWLVRKLFPAEVYKALYACRSQRTLLPMGHLVELKKFAPMGSSCCFPVEALVFWALAVGSLKDIYQSRHIKCLPDVYVYGDDIIVHRDDYGKIRQVFEELFLRFSDHKCCTGRFFRESCGTDAFKGQSVSPVRLRSAWTENLSPKALLSYVAYANALRGEDRGYVSASDYLEARIQQSYGALPIKVGTEGYPLAYYRKDGSQEDVEASLKPFKIRYNKRYQRREVLLPHVLPRTSECERASYWEEALQRLRKGPPDPFGVGGAYVPPGRYVLPHNVKLRWDWTSIECLFS